MADKRTKGELLGIELRLFVEIIKAGRMNAVASQFGITQPSVTNALRRLEGVLGARLLNRGKGIKQEITPDGERALPLIKCVVDAEKNLLAAFGKQPKIEGVKNVV